MLRLSTCAVLLFATACAADAPTGGGGDTDGKGDNGAGGGGGGSGGGGGGGGATMTPGEYLTAVGMKECDQAFTCKASFPTEEGAFEDYFGATASACYADAAMYYDAAAVQASIAANKLAFDGAAAKACISGIGAPACATYWTEGPAWPAACDAVMTGKVPDGGTCAIDFECSNVESYCLETAKCGADPQAPAAPRRWTRVTRD